MSTPARAPASSGRLTCGDAANRVRFLHSGDWQLGMMRRFLGPEAQARFGQARIDAVDRIGAIAADDGAAFLVVAGDVFDANQIDRQVVLRACEALRTVPCPVYLLPGNHDALEPGAIWKSPTFRHHAPSHVEILDTPEPRTPVPGVEVVGVPWRTRRPDTDPVTGEVALDPADGVLRVLVGHGKVDALAPDPEEPSLVSQASLEQLVGAGAAHYVALGDRHSLTSVGATGRIWYAGSPEPTRPEEERPGEVLRVDLSSAECTVTPIRVGTWRLLSRVADLDDDPDVDRLAAWFADQPDKTRTVVRLGVRGVVPVSALTRLEVLLDAQAELFAGIQRWQLHWDLQVQPDDDALDALPVTGPARLTLEELRTHTGGGDTEAADALALFHRLAGGAA